MAATRIDMVCAELESRDPGDFIVEARQYARAHPTQVLIGMFAVGAVAGRLMRGASITRRPEALIDVRDTRMSSIPDPGYIA
jgi:hypothetical protein